MHAPAPRFVTPRDPAFASEGVEIARLARMLGKPLMPWQRTVVDVATERDAFGRYRYPKVLVTVPRQSGKTTLVGPVQVHRIMTRPAIKAFFTAQTGKDGRARMLDLIKLVTTSPIAPLFKARYAAGSEGLSVGNGSSLSVFAPGPSALHGETPHLVTLDEIWKHDQARGTELMGAIGPAQATLEGESQVWMISTMGTAASGFMNDLVEQGRAGVPGLCYAEWSLPDGLDPYEPQSWWVFHPALGNTISQSYLAQEARDQPLGEWMRAYCNRLTSSSDPLIADAEWAAMGAEPQAVPALGDVVLGYELHDGTGSVVAGWRDATGTPCVRTVHTAPGDIWLVPLLARLQREWQPAAIAADDGGETRRITDELRRAGVEVLTTSAVDIATATASLLAAARSGQLHHDGSRTFASAVRVAVLQPMGDGFRFSRKHSAGPIGGLIAAAVALWFVNHQEEQLGKPEVYAPRIAS